MFQLNLPTRYCKICFKEINDNSFYNLTHSKNIICEDCFSTFKARFKHFEIGSVKALAIYDYDDVIKKLIYELKGCYDYELKDVFLSRYLSYLKWAYNDYILVPTPSSDVDDEKRGFNHVEEMFKCMKLPMKKVIKKKSNEKQSSKTSKDRLNIDNVLVCENLGLLYKKKVLIVDDIYTTGATMFKMVELVKTAQPKDIKVLVVAKTIDLDKRQQKPNIP